MTAILHPSADRVSPLPASPLAALRLCERELDYATALLGRVLEQLEPQRQGEQRRG